MKRDFNEKVLALRDKKIVLVEQIKAKHEKLGVIHQQISATVIKLGPPIPAINEETECPETQYQVSLKELFITHSNLNTFCCRAYKLKKITQNY